MMHLIILSLLLSELVIPAGSRTVTDRGTTGSQPIVTAGAVNWWDASARPGQGENVVLYGHDTDVFKNLHQVKPGAVITLRWQGRDFNYIVTRLFWVSEAGPIEERVKNGQWIQPAGYERLTLITCRGSDRLIVLAEPK